MRLTVLGGCGAWPAAGQACSGYLLEQDGFRLLLTHLLPGTAPGQAEDAARAVALAAAGRLEEAGAVLDVAPPLRPDFYFSVFATLRAMAVVAVGRRQPAEELYAALLPVSGQLAGAASTSLAMRPAARLGLTGQTRTR